MHILELLDNGNDRNCCLLQNPSLFFEDLENQAFLVNSKEVCTEPTIHALGNPQGYVVGGD